MDSSSHHWPLVNSSVEPHLVTVSPHPQDSLPPHALKQLLPSNSEVLSGSNGTYFQNPGIPTSPEDLRLCFEPQAASATAGAGRPYSELEPHLQILLYSPQKLVAPARVSWSLRPFRKPALDDNRTLNCHLFCYNDITTLEGAKQREEGRKDGFRSE